jgi:hypothetical protein
MDDKAIPSFDSIVTKSILVNNEFQITQVCNLESIRSLTLNKDQYPQIVQLIKNSDFKKIIDLPFGNNDFEYLEIMRFSDQAKKNYIVTIYSNDSLENDPQVIDIFSLL